VHIDAGYITDLADIESLFKRLIDSDAPFGGDIETGYYGPPREKFSLHPETAFPVGMSVSGNTSWGRYVPLRHDLGSNVDNQDFARLVAPLLGTGRMIAANAVFELRHLAKFVRERLTRRELEDAGLEPDGYFTIFSDPMLEAFVLGIFQEHGLKYLTDIVFGYKMTELKEFFPGLTETQLKALRFNILELTPAVVSYACDDSAAALGLSRKHLPQVQDRLIFKTEMQLIPILARMEDYGVALDWDAMARALHTTERFAELMRQDILRTLSEQLNFPVVLNLNSPAQIANILYDKLGLKVVRRTKKGGKPSTDEKALSRLAKQHTVVQDILHYRELRKLITSYLKSYPLKFNYAEDGRTHSNIQQTVVVSGRYSVRDPNNQQFPKLYHYELRTTDEVFDLKFRDFVVAGYEHYLIGFDYKQMELRVLAGFSRDPALWEAFDNDLDPHAWTASLLFNIALSDVTDKQRDIGKTFNFATSYQQGVDALAEALDRSVEEAQELQDRFFAVYSSAASWISQQKARGIQNRYTVSRFGRRHPIWDLDSEYRSVRSKGERLCVNAPIQGSAADITKIGMVRASRSIKTAGLQDQVHLIMNIHDALVFEVHKSVNPQAVINTVGPAVTFDVPDWPKFSVDWEIGLKWGSMKKLKLDENDQIIVPRSRSEKAVAAG
jgi:DNA polymerase I